MKLKSVLFVCLGNICRSPLAEGIARHLSEKNHWNLKIDSCGTSSFHRGEPPHHKSIKIAQKLENKGFFAPAIKEPTVPKGKPRIRFSLHSGLEKEELIHLVDSL